MSLTEEQKERIKKNREKALRIQKERREKKEREEIKDNEGKSKLSTKEKTVDSFTRITSELPLDRKTVTEDYDEYCDVPLADFEEGASEWISKKEAMTQYCLPEGTMAICSYEEKKNPRNPSFKPMKLYKRGEIRYRALKRHGGLEGLVEERKKRRKRKLEKDMEEAMDIFK